MLAIYFVTPTQQLHQDEYILSHYHLMLACCCVWTEIISLSIAHYYVRLQRQQFNATSQTQRHAQKDAHVVPATMKISLYELYVTCLPTFPSPTVPIKLAAYYISLKKCIFGVDTTVTCSKPKHHSELIVRVLDNVAG